MKQILNSLTKKILIVAVLIVLSLVVSTSIPSSSNVYALANCSSQSNVTGNIHPEQSKTATCDEALDCKDGLAANQCGITAVIINITNLLSALVGVVTVIVIIVGGIQYAASSGDAQAVIAAKKRITNALLALVMFGFIYAFLQWVIPGGAL